MKKHVVWIDDIDDIKSIQVFSFLTHVCLIKEVLFNAIRFEFKGRFECECTDEIWDNIVEKCARYHNYYLYLHEEF